MSRTPFKMKSGNTPMFKTMGSSPVQYDTPMKATVPKKKQEGSKVDKKGNVDLNFLNKGKASATQTIYKNKNLGKKGLYKSDKSWKEGESSAKKGGGDLNSLTKQRKTLKKGSFEYNKVQNKINAALGNKKRYDEGPAIVKKDTETNVVKDKGVENKVVVPTKTDKKITKVTGKGEKKIGEVKENVTKKTAKIRKQEAKKLHGKGSKEHLKAKMTHLKTKEADRQGKQGGKKRGLFRGLASKINKRRQERTQAKIDTPTDDSKKKTKNNKKLRKTDEFGFLIGPPRHNMFGLGMPNDTKKSDKKPKA